MSIHHARSQLCLLRPQLVTRVATRRVHALALTAKAPPARRPTAHIVAMGAVLSASVATLLREDALCQQLANVFAQVSDGPSGSSGAKKSPDDLNGNRRPSLKDEIDRLVDQMTSRCGEISMAGGLGFCSGYALKQVGKVAAVTIGTLFIIAQVASSKGYIEIHWHKVEKDVIKAVDPDGDGKITKDDVKEWYRRAMAVLQANLPSSAGFAGGFLLGISCS